VVLQFLNYGNAYVRPGHHPL